QAQVKIIDDILDVSRVITGNFRIDTKPTDVVAIVRDALEVIRPAASAKKISIDFMPSSDFCLMIADPERLQQVVWNVLSNAVKFTDSGAIQVRVGPEGSKVVISVRDTGKGIDPAFVPHVFERFRQADSTITRRVGGLGLGLALARHIVELHGGGIAAESDGLGKGATFTITLPVRAIVPVPLDSPQRTSASTGSDEAQSLQGIRILIVDDEPDARDMLAEVLQSAGAIAETARSAAEGYERFRAAPPDVLISDIGMPEEDGYSFIRRIRALPGSEAARVPALALTAFTRPEDRTSASAAGFTTHVSKPVDPEALVSAIANLVNTAN
ncbi:MAG TPA: ATP-binding protein, partial [Polyangiaceae bacterium]|nr:ATP-binding protein [Polyangiaceae bacterium]